MWLLFTRNERNIFAWTQCIRLQSGEKKKQKKRRIKWGKTCLPLKAGDMNQRSAKPEPKYWPSEERNKTIGRPYNRLKMKNCSRKGPEEEGEREEKRKEKQQTDKWVKWRKWARQEVKWWVKWSNHHFVAQPHSNFSKGRIKNKWQGKVVLQVAQCSTAHCTLYFTLSLLPLLM